MTSDASGGPILEQTMGQLQSPSQASRMFRRYSWIWIMKASDSCFSAPNLKSGSHLDLERAKAVLEESMFDAASQNSNSLETP